MNFELHSYRFSREIIEHPDYDDAYDEITSIVKQCPLFTFTNKSLKNSKLDIVQQLFNTFFDRKFACECGWDYHPNATNIPGSDLAADYRKEFNGLRIQAEVQFGNMARWYSDIFKFQTAYSQGMIDMGLCIVPMYSIAKRMDSNVTNFERCVRELPSAKLSITLPILLIGLEDSFQTPKINVAHAGFSGIQDIIGRGRTENRYRIVNGIISKTKIAKINEKSPTGPIASLTPDPDNLEN